MRASECPRVTSGFQTKYQLSVRWPAQLSCSLAKFVLYSKLATIGSMNKVVVEGKVEVIEIANEMGDCREVNNIWLWKGFGVVWLG